jgi:hypothetical protein
VTPGEYEWSLPSDETLSEIKCLTMVGEAFDDGRYRQVSYETTTPDCKDTINRKSMADDSVTQTYTFTVWPDIVPPVDGTLIELVVDETTGALPSL